MKSEKSLMYLLIAGEVLILLAVVLLGTVKKVTVSDTEIEDAVVSVQGNQIADIPNMTEVVTETQEEVPQEEVPAVQFSEEIEAMLGEMSIEEKVSQLFIVSPEALTGIDRVTIAGQGTRDAFAQYQVGGMLYARQNFLGRVQMGDLIRGAQTMSSEHSDKKIFTGTFVEIDGNKFIAVSAAGQEAALVELMALDTPPQSENVAGMLQIRYAQALEEVSMEETENGLCCYAAANGGESAIEAIKQGADMLCVTDAFSPVYEMLLEAVHTGEISEMMLKRAVGRILTQKQMLL